MDNLKPDFLGIGAQRAATTWLYQVLRRHPDVYLSEKKEVHFFDENYEQGWDWYLEHFRDSPPGKLRGEITPNYLDQPEAAARIAQDLPDVRMFVVLREPVSRARSSYELLRHRFPNQSFEQACVQDGYLVNLGLYAKHLKRFFQIFDRSQIHVIVYDDLTSAPEATLFGLYDFLGLSRQPLPQDVSQGTNSVLLPRTQHLLKRLRCGGIIDFAKRGGVGEALRYLNRQAKRLRQSQPRERRLQHLFRSDIEELERLISRDLRHWLH